MIPASLCFCHEVVICSAQSLTSLRFDCLTGALAEPFMCLAMITAPEDWDMFD